MAETIVMLDPRILKVHPRNAEFFDDVNGAEYDRLIESIKDHGVLTPLRVTKDMTIISGHQRTRAAIEAECFSVPVVIDESEDENDVLMKLIETNFGRIKNDKVKQAKWLEEYKKLRGIRHGGNRAKGNNFLLKDVADELGVDVRTLTNLQQLLKLDPAIQALISDGKINATTGFKILSKLTPEEQQKLLDKLPDNVKFSAKSIEDYIEQMRSEFSKNTSKVVEDKDKLEGELSKLRRENNELRSGALPISAETQEKINRLETERREFYESAQKAKKQVEELDKACKKSEAEIKRLKSAADGSDDAVIEMQNEIDSLQEQLKEAERKAGDLEYQLGEKDDEINTLKREKRDGFIRKALRMDETPEELTQRERDALVSNIQIAIGQFQSSVEGFLTQTDSINMIDKAIVKVLVETCSQAVTAGNRLKVALLTACGPSDSGDDADDDPTYALNESDFDLDLGA